MKHAYIFDVDGVLLRTMEAHFECYEQALKEVHIPIDKAQFYRQAGMTGIEQIRYFAAKAGTPVEPEKVYARKRELFANYIEQVEEIRCNIELLGLLKAAGFPVAVASGSARRSWVPILAKFVVEADALVGAEDVERGKPYPDLYLCAAQKLNVQPACCIVIEDSEAGIEAARSAGMKAMRFYDNVPEG